MGKGTQRLLIDMEEKQFELGDWIRDRTGGDIIRIDEDNIDHYNSPDVRPHYLNLSVHYIHEDESIREMQRYYEGK